MNQLTRLNAILLHYSFSDKCQMFANVNSVINLSHSDHVLHHSLLYLSKKQMMIDLSAIKTEKIYILFMKKTLSADDFAYSLQIGEKHLLLHVNMNVEFLWEVERVKIMKQVTFCVKDNCLSLSMIDFESKELSCMNSFNMFSSWSWHQTLQRLTRWLLEYADWYWITFIKNIWNDLMMFRSNMICLSCVK